jgi:redox-sensitive bicupin YhaK (pirin superfamily)
MHNSLAVIAYGVGMEDWPGGEVMGLRRIMRITTGVPATDGAGVRMTRLIGTEELDNIDPFLMLDAFQTENPDDYIAGFPSHPHRGFETVTYMFAGRLRHKDSTGREGVITAGGVQWMSAGKGIIHSEMPEQEDGLMWGTQLWVNLPASQKMTPPSYQEFDADRLPKETRPGDVEVTVVAGTTAEGTAGAVTDRPVEPLYFDVRLPQAAIFREPLPETHSAFLFVVDGSIGVTSDGNEAPVAVAAGKLAVLGDGDGVEITGIGASNRFLLIAGRAINEPIARGGPFVMNTQEEIQQAISDYQSGRF